ncbi:MAG TPA: UTP--glucose-1-phosphate uridylyltransferase [Polyangiaceae bacterium]|nr:UTP--glucose-1-phosphate uridylyltransferase [Polyangiaceae bacterium]
MSELKAQLAALPEDVKARLTRYGFDPERLLKLGEKLARGEVDAGVVTGRVEAPGPNEVVTPPAAGTPEYAALEERGAAALRAGKVALVVLAGGMATRMGGVVKALVEALPGKTFLDVRLAEIDALARRYGQAPPLWLMTSDATDAGIREALGARLDGYQVATFTQSLALRLTPDGKLFLDEKGRPSEHAPGHGDLPDALKQSGLLGRFVEGGGELLLLTNLDNLGGTLDPALIGFHLAHAHPVTSEVVDKLADDRGGIPVRVDGKLRILEEFRIPPSFDPQTVRVFNTNTFYVDARALLELEMDWRFFAVKKKVGDTPVIQFERIVNEITSELSTVYLRLPREGASSRFLPVKDPAELERRRPEIAAVGRARGIL